MNNNAEGAATFFDILAFSVAYGVLWVAAVWWGGFDGPLAPLYALKASIRAQSVDQWFQLSGLVAVLAGVVLVILNPFRGRDSYGGAHWATEREIKKMALRADSGIILGELRGRYLRTAAPLSIFVDAPPGSGKTAAVVIPSLLSLPHSVIVHDPKGELLEKTGPFRSQFSKVLRFSPGERDSATWNPLSRRELPEDWDDVVVYVDRIGTGLFAPAKKGEGADHWLKMARAVFKFWALYLIHQNGSTSFPEIRSAAFASTDMQGEIAVILDDPETPRVVREEGAPLVGTGDKEWGSVQNTFKGYMDVFSDPRVAANVSGDGDFALRDLRKESVSVFLIVRASDQTRLKPLLSLFFEAAALMIIHEEPKPSEQWVTLMLDEFVRLARLQEVLELPAISRSYKGNVVFVCQSAAQVVDIYGKEGLEKLTNTCAYRVVFSQNEVSVAETISKSIGNMTRKKTSRSLNGKDLFGSRSESEEGVPLVRPQEILSLPFGRIIILTQNHYQSPIAAKAAFWFKDPAQKRLIKKGATTHVEGNDDNGRAGAGDADGERSAGDAGPGELGGGDREEDGHAA